MTQIGKYGVMAIVFAGLVGCSQMQPAKVSDSQLGKPLNLRCEYLSTPMGLDMPAPRLSWEVNDARRGAMQSAYEIIVSTDPRMADDQAIVWNSGKINTDQSIHVVYQGKPLQGNTRYYWRVRTYDTAGNCSPASDATWFETGLMDSGQWLAKWIAPVEQDDTAKLDWGDWIWNADAAGPEKSACFRTTLTVPADDKVVTAVIKITADDHFILHVNGNLIGESSDWKHPRKYDLARDIVSGKNVITMKASNHASKFGLTFSGRIALASGKKIEFRSGPECKTAIDAAPNWMKSDFDDSAWPQAVVVAAYGSEPWQQLEEPGGVRRSQHLRKEFQVKGPIAKARVFASGLGLYELFVNGKKAGHDLFAPGWTKYDKRIQYQTYDVTQMLKAGDNAIGATLGNGWYSGGLGWSMQGQTGSGQPRFILQMEIDYADGSHERIVTDATWQNYPSPIARNTFYHGETYDARLEIPRWAEAGLDSKLWQNAIETGDHLDVLVAQTSEPIRVTDELPALQVEEPQPGIFIVDFGQNQAGRVRIQGLKANVGTQIRLRFGEELNPDGTLYRDNYRSAEATDFYICKGGLEESWAPQFTYRGYRYCEVTGWPGRPIKDNFVAQVLHSAPAPAANFECSHWLLNRIHQNTLWGQRSNMHSVPTDCPQRDERLGWMGDAQAFSAMACWNMQMASFFTKWMHDIADSQNTDGAVTDVAPLAVVRGPAAPGWGDAVTVIPWMVYCYYGDTRIIEQNYPAMVAWVEYMRKNAENGLLYEREGYGDWVAVVESPKKPIGAAFYFYSTKLLAQMAAAIGKMDDANKYAELARQIADAFNARYLDKENNYPSGTQTANILPLWFGITPESKRPAVLKHITDDIIARGYHHSTGFMGTNYILPLLSKYGQDEIACRMLSQRSYPSLGYMACQGATTIWERWNTDKMGPSMNSRNHFAFGGMCQWLIEAAAGIRLDPAHPGFKHTIIDPRPAGELTWVRAEYPSMYGSIRVEWHHIGDVFWMYVSIPANTTACIHVPTLGRANATITEGGKPVVTAGKPVSASVKCSRIDATSAAFEVGAGNYAFVLNGNP